MFSRYERNVYCSEMCTAYAKNQKSSLYFQPDGKYFSTLVLPVLGIQEEIFVPLLNFKGHLLVFILNLAVGAYRDILFVFKVGTFNSLSAETAEQCSQNG